MSAAALIVAASPAVAAPARVIVKLKPEATASGGEARSGERAQTLAARRGVALTGQRAVGNRVRVVTATGMSSSALAQQLAADPEVEYAVPDRRMRPMAVPDDRLYGQSNSISPPAGQWYLRRPDTLYRSAIDAERAWDISKGDNVVVAVLDTGVRFEHPDLRRVSDGGKLLDGYDFVRDDDIANDGDGRDDDPSDPGDWMTVAEVQRDPNDDFDEDCVRDPDDGQLRDTRSSWHGTEVAGILGAMTDNSTGMAGTGWNVRLLPVRVLGRCGGFASDIGAAMRWAAGLPIDGVPDNPNPAKILNLSLGGPGQCQADYRDAVAEVVAAGATVVVSAGNTEGREVSEPANCEGVIAVAGLRHNGTKVSFSDLGPEVTISAPGGNCLSGVGSACEYPLLTTANSGVTEPDDSIYTDGVDRITIGTSFSAPLVSGVAALALAVQPRMTPAELNDLLQRTASDFPTTGAAVNTPQCQAPGTAVQDECYCTTSTCGAGMLNAREAVEAAVGVIARITLGTEQPQENQLLTLSAADSPLTAGRTLRSATWSIRSGGGIVDGFEGASTGVAVSVRPSGGGSFTVRMTATDSAGDSSSVDKTVRVEGEEEDNDFGSGALGFGYLAALLAAVVVARRAVRRGEGG